MSLNILLASDSRNASSEGKNAIICVNVEHGIGKLSSTLARLCALLLLLIDESSQAYPSYAKTTDMYSIMQAVASCEDEGNDIPSYMALVCEQVMWMSEVLNVRVPL